MSKKISLILIYKIRNADCPPVGSLFPAARRAPIKVFSKLF